MSQTSDMPSIHDLFRKVQEHPDYVFGTIFTVEDFSRNDHNHLGAFPVYDAVDALSTAGNEFIEAVGYTPDIYDEDEDDNTDEEYYGDEQDLDNFRFSDDDLNSLQDVDNKN